MKKAPQGIGAGLFVVLALSACAFDAEKETGLGENRQALVDTRVAAQAFLNGYIRSDNISAVVYSAYVPDPHLTELALVSGHWIRSDLTTLTGAVKPSAFCSSAYVRADGPSAVVFRSDDGHIRELVLSGGSWSKADLTALTGAALSSTCPHGYVRGDGVSAVVYVSTDNHVRELSLRPGGSWAAADLTVIAHAPLAQGSQTFGYVRGDGTTSVIYSTVDRHLRELALVGGTWQSFDLTASAGAPLAASNGRPYTRSDRTSSVLFFSDDKHVRELALVGGAWKSFDLSSASGAPLADVPGYDPVPYVRSDGWSTVIYAGEDKHIRELSMSPRGVWSVADLTAITGAPASFMVTAGAYVRSDLVNAVIYYDTNGHIHELSLPKTGGTWAHADLTAIAGGP